MQYLLYNRSIADPAAMSGASPFANGFIMVTGMLVLFFTVFVCVRCCNRQRNSPPAATGESSPDPNNDLLPANRGGPAPAPAERLPPATTGSDDQPPAESSSLANQKVPVPDLPSSSSDQPPAPAAGAASSDGVQVDLQATPMIARLSEENLKKLAGSLGHESFDVWSAQAACSSASEVDPNKSVGKVSGTNTA